MSYRYRFTGLDSEEFPTLSAELAAERGHARLDPGDEITVTVPISHPRLDPANASTRKATEALADGPVPAAGADPAREGPGVVPAPEEAVQGLSGDPAPTAEEG